EMLKKEKDSESKQRLADLEADIVKLEREFSDLNEVWKSEKAALQGATRIKEQIEAARLELEAAQRRQDYAKMSEIQYGKLRTGEAARRRAGRREAGVHPGAGQGHRRGDRRGGGALVRHPGGEDAGRRAREAAAHGGRPAP